VKTIRFDASIHHNAKLYSEKIAANDLWLIDHFGIKDWNGKEFDRDILLKYDKWVVNEDKSVILKGLGGGGHEIPEMYDLIYKGDKVHLWCGGGGNRASAFVKQADGSYDKTVFVSRIWIPPELSREQDSVLALIVEAFAVEYLSSSASRNLTVEFNL
jgi:hypothetical protein